MKHLLSVLGNFYRSRTPRQKGRWKIYGETWVSFGKESIEQTNMGHSRPCICKRDWFSARVKPFRINNIVRTENKVILQKNVIYLSYTFYWIVFYSCSLTCFTLKAGIVFLYIYILYYCVFNCMFQYFMQWLLAYFIYNIQYILSIN